MNAAAARQREPRKAEPPIVAGRVPPHDLDAEAAVLSACLLKRDVLDEVVPLLKAEDFYSRANELIFEACVALATVGKPIDIVAVAAWLRDREQLAEVGGSAYLANIVDATPAVAHVVDHAKIVATKRQIRLVIAECQRISAEGYGDIGAAEEWLADAEGTVSRVTARTRAVDANEHAGPILKRAWAAVMAQIEGKSPPGLSTGNAQLDRLLNYMRPGNVMIIAARSHIGKSALARQIAAHVAGIGTNVPEGGVLLWSGEQEREEVATCMTFQAARLAESKAREKHRLTPSDWRALTTTASDFGAAPMWIVDQPAITPLRLRIEIRDAKRKAEKLQAEAERAARERGEVVRGDRRLKLAVVDYVQLMSAAGLVAKSANRENEVSAISRKLKEIAGAEKVALIVLAQLNKNGDKRSKEDAAPQPSDLRESDALYQDADKAVFIHNPHAIERMRALRDGERQEDPEAEIVRLIVSKARGGGTTGAVRSVFFPTCGRFEPYDGRHDPDEAH